MKSLNISGTTSETFTIGQGFNRVELRVLDGKLYFRNSNEPFKPLLSNDAETILSPLQWTSNRDYSEGDLFYYEKILFKVINSHNSTNGFFANNNNYRKVSHINGDLTKIDTNAYQTNSYELDILSSDFVYIYGLISSVFTIKLPDSSSISLGSSYTFQNNSQKIINIYNNNNVFITFLNPNETKKLTLIDYETEFSLDTWSIFSFMYDSINFANIDANKITFATGVNYSFIGASGIFSTDRSGKYNFYDINDADLNGDIYWTSGGVSYKIITFSTKMASGDISSKFCYFDIDGILYFKNNTETSREIIFQNIYKQGI